VAAPDASLLARIIASLALGTVLREFVRAYMGERWPFPSAIADRRLGGGVLVVPANLAIVVVSSPSRLLFLLFEKTIYGKAILAACDTKSALACRVRSRPSFLAIWILASVLATTRVFGRTPSTLSPDMD